MLGLFLPADFGTCFQAYEALAALSTQFETILAAEDALDGAALEATLKAMATESALTRWVVRQLAAQL